MDGWMMRAAVSLPSTTRKEDMYDTPAEPEIKTRTKTKPQTELNL